MLILAVDTSYKTGSVSLLRDELVLSTAEVEGGLFSAQLVPRIAALLQQQGIGKQEIEGYAAAVGPGSFTGLRIGLAAIKGLAEIMPRPIAAVSVLEAIAFAGSEKAKGATSLIAAMDASRREIYLGSFEQKDDRLRPTGEILCSELGLKEQVSPTRDSLLITPEQRIAELARNDSIPVLEIPWPGSEAVGKLGFRKIARGETVTPDELDANYIRRDDNLFFRQGTRPQ
jgi:tRNA threonylcarbamoyladenosine biosynthesis protein TsaB